jgi:hypothetical protein
VTTSATGIVEPTDAAHAESGGARRIDRQVRQDRAVIDLFVYVVVLNLAIEYVPSVISEGFTLSLPTAALLKITLELVLLLKGQILTRLRAATTRRAKLAAAGAFVGSRGRQQARRELIVGIGPSLRHRPRAAERSAQAATSAR